MTNILFVTPGPIKWASSRMRAHWIAERIEGAEVMTNDKRHLSKGWDAVIFVKVIEEPMIINALQGLGTKVFWDICDPVHWFNPQEAWDMADCVDGIVASNVNLKHDFEQWYGHNILMIPDRIKLEHFPKQQKHYDIDPVKFIWYGASQNRFSLFGAFAALERLACDGVDLSLTIFDDRPQDTNIQSNKFPVYYTNWDLGLENDVLASHDIALLPPYPGAWGKVKSNNKELTAWACGLPATDGENYAELYGLATSSEQRREIANEGMETLKAYYTIDKSVDQWKELLCA